MYNCIYTYRVKKGLTQTELAHLCGLSQNSISSIESGKWTPSVKHALYIAYALDCKIEDLFYLNDPTLFCKFVD